MGELVKHTFKTRANNLPLATVSNFEQSISEKDGSNIWLYDITMSNGAVAYYLYSDESDETYTDDSHFTAWFCYYGILTQNQNYAYGPVDWETVGHGRSKSKLTVCTWAINSSNTVGNYYCGYYPTKSTARAKEVNYVLDGIQSDCIPMKKNVRITKVYRKQ